MPKTNTRRARRGNKRLARGAYRSSRNPMHFPLTKVPMARSTMYPAPAELDTTLRWYVNFILTNAGLSYAGVRFYSNSALSPDIVTPSNKPNGFTALSGIYGSYRVIGYKYDISILSRENFGFVAMVRNTNTDPGTGSGQLAFCGEALSTAKHVPPIGAPAVHIRGQHTIAEVTGRPIENDDILAADVSSNPSDLTFLGLFLQAGTETFTAAVGANCSVIMDLKVRFFNRKNLNDSSSKVSHPIIIDTNKEAELERARAALASLDLRDK